MLSAMNTFREIIDAWPSAFTLADDIGEREGTIRQWRHRDRIPSTKWRAMIEAAKRRRISGITPARLVDLAAEKNGNGKAT